MMLRGYDGILCSAGFDQLRPFFRLIIIGSETISLFEIIFV